MVVVYTTDRTTFRRVCQKNIDITDYSHHNIKLKTMIKLTKSFLQDCRCMPQSKYCLDLLSKNTSVKMSELRKGQWDEYSHI